MEIIGLLGESYGAEVNSESQRPSIINKSILTNSQEKSNFLEAESEDIIIGDNLMGVSRTEEIVDHIEHIENIEHIDHIDHIDYIEHESTTNEEGVPESIGHFSSEHTYPHFISKEGEGNKIEKLSPSTPGREGEGEGIRAKVPVPDSPKDTKLDGIFPELHKRNNRLLVTPSITASLTSKKSISAYSDHFEDHSTISAHQIENRSTYHASQYKI